MGPSGLMARQPPLTYHILPDPELPFLHVVQQVDLNF